MNLNDLIAQQEALDAQQSELNRRIEAAMVKQDVIVNIRAQMESAGVTLDDLGYGSTKAASTKPGTAKASTSRKGTRIEPKFKAPTGETWTGRGLQPRWLKQALAGGATLDQFKIAA
jgi:DNA-binding protein H-NS